MKTILRNYINCIETDQPQGVISYLEPEILNEFPNVWTEESGADSTNFTSYSEIGLTLKPLIISTETYQVKSNFSLAMAKDIQELHGVNASDMLKSTLINEMEQTVEKKILEEMRGSAEGSRKDGWSKFQMWTNKWFGYSPKIEWTDPNHIVSDLIFTSNKMLAETRMGGIPFVIVSSGIRSCLEGSQYFTYLENTKLNNSGIFEAGILMGRIKVLVNPYMEFDNFEILMGIKPDTNTSARIFMIENPEPIFVETVDESTMEAVLNLGRRFGIKSVGSKNYAYIELADRGKKHNLFTHLVSKLFNLIKR